MAQAQNILNVAERNRSLRETSSVSTSPTATFSQPSSFGGALARRGVPAAPKQLKPFNTNDIKILLLENVNESGKVILTGQGYQVETLKTSLPEDQLIEKIR
jgi:D-3-phosphoglycerate dehydrogenase